jgi:hypothetical protein
MMKKISICVPTAELKKPNGEKCGVDLLNTLLITIDRQTFKDYEIIISDHSINDDIENSLTNWKHLDIKYYRNELGRGIPAVNLNNAISKSNGEFIKIMFQDDLFYDEKTLEYISSHTDQYQYGFVGSYCCVGDDTTNLINPLSPSWGSADTILEGANTVGGPTVMFFKNDGNYFDENLCWLNDTELYYRLYLKYGNPLCLPNLCVIQRLRTNGLSNTIPMNVRYEEKKYVLNKHKSKF